MLNVHNLGLRQTPAHNSGDCLHPGVMYYSRVLLNCWMCTDLSSVIYITNDLAYMQFITIPVR